MTIAVVLDFAGGTREQYDEVIERMQLGGHMPPGGQVHVAGSHAGGWRVIDVWESREAYEHFRDDQIMPHVQAVGLSPPQPRVLDVDDEMPHDGRRTAHHGQGATVRCSPTEELQWKPRCPAGTSDALRSYIPM